jgi:CARDB
VGGGRRASGGGRRTPGSGRRPPTDEQAIRVRRAVAAVALVVVVILIAVGVHSCQVSQRNSALRNYSDSVASIIRASDQTSQQLFTVLSSGQGASNGPNLQSQVDEARLSAENQLNRGAGLDVPDQVKGAQQDLLLALQLRRDGIATIAQQIQPALQPSTATDAIAQIAAAMARFYASDVTYKDYALPGIVSALHIAGIPVGGTNGEPVEGGQFLPDVQWLTPSFVATQLHTSFTPTAKNGKVAPGTHGHSLDSVSAGGTTLQTGSTNTIPASPAPTFTLTLTNSGSNNETNVVCKVTLSNSSVSGTTTVPQTQAGQQTNCQVPLSSSPKPGSYTLTATIQPVPGEKNSSNNTQTFPVTFQ